MIALAQVRAEVVERVSEVRSTDIHTSVGSPRLAAEALGWRPRIAWPETLRTLLDHWRTRIAAATGGRC